MLSKLMLSIFNVININNIKVSHVYTFFDYTTSNINWLWSFIHIPSINGMEWSGASINWNGWS